MIFSNKDASSVVQVSYSATWSMQTQADFISCLDSLIEKIDEFPNEVQKFLVYWRSQSHSVPLSKARSLWLEAVGEATSDFAGFTNEVDRNALISYALSGQLLEKEADISSTVMFSNPPSSTAICRNMHFIQSIPEKHKLWEKVETMNQTLNEKKIYSVVDAAVAVLVERVKLLQQRIISGVLEVEVKLGTVSLSNSELITSIRSLKPGSMSWNNVPDYMHPKDFHNTARKYSEDDTIHTLYSMNWIRNVYGVNHVDIMAQPGDKRETMKSLINNERDAICSP